MSEDIKEDTQEQEAPETKPRRRKKPAPQFSLGQGLDIGTMNLVSARKKGSKIQTKRMRDCFLDLDLDAKKMLALAKDVSYVEQEDRLLILGDAAIETANIFGREARRPLAGGLISSSEIDALEVLSILIENVVGPPLEDGEVCVYSIPAAPLDNPDQDVIYHEAVFERILSDLGYDAISGNEALAIIYSECADTMFSGIGISFGSGMTNIAMSYKTISVDDLEFSVQRGGDWIDGSSANSVGSTASKMCMIKESGLNLMDPSEGPEKYQREREALVMYYKALISYAIDKIAKKFKSSKGNVELNEPIPIVISGGTSLAKGFVELFQQVFEKKRRRFPIEVSEIRHADDPMTAVAQGLLIQAMQEYSDE